MSIKFRLIGSVSMIFLIIVGMFAATWIVTSSQKNDSLVINLAGRQRMLSQKLAKETLAFGAIKSDALKAQIASTIDVFETTLEALSDSGEAPLTTDPTGAMAKLPAASSAVHVQLVKVSDLWVAYKAEIEKAVTSGEPDVVKISSQSVEVLKTMDTAVVMMQGESEDRVFTLLITQLVCVLIGVVIVLIVLYNLNTKLTTPLGNLQKFAGQIADGDLDVSISGAYTEELLALKDAIVTMVDNLKENMTEVAVKGEQAEKSAAEARKATDEAKAQQAQVRELLDIMSRAAAEAGRISQNLASSVGQLASQVDQVGHGTEIQRDRMAETATAMEEMNATVLEVARNASSAAESAGRARENAQTGADGVRAAVLSIDAIKIQILDLNSSMSELGKQAEDIGNIMNVVTDIADQTNLLALNAAIEAARAGEAGRGFAVVADEVRKLAEKTMQATKQVGDAVNKIQTQARENITAVEKSVEDIVKSTDAANESGQYMTEIVAIVEETAGQVESIAAASEEQSAASEEINRAVADVTQIASETAEGMIQAAQALESMSTMASELDVVIRDMSDDSGPKTASFETPVVGRAVQKRSPEASGRKLSDRSGLRVVDPKGLIQWSDDLSVNIRWIDEEHIKLINLINSLQNAMRTGKGQEVVLSILNELKDYTVFHFNDEEALFEEHNYSGQVKHMAAHKKFVNTIIAFEEDVLSGKSSVTMEIMDFLKDWLISHIQGDDQKYSQFFNNKGVY